MRIQHKLFVAFLLTGISLVVLMFFLMQWSLTKGLLEFINTKERDNIAPFVEVLKSRYQQQQNWAWIDGRHRLFHELFRDNIIDKNQPFDRRPPPKRRGPPRRDQGQGKDNTQLDGRLPHPEQRARRNDGSGRGPGGGLRHRPGPRPTDLSLFDQHKKFLVGKHNATDNDHWMAIKADNQVVGWLVIPRRLGITQGYELTLLEQQRSTFIVISLLLIALTILIALPLARNLVQPIKQLAQGMNQLTQGDYQTRVALKRNDELGRLSRDVNELAVTLEHNDTARKRWLADISHELRTPIAVLKSEMEAVIDGIRPLDKALVGSSYQEVQRLQRLVEDLYELTSADIGGMKYRKEEFDLVELLKDEQPQFQQLLNQSNIKLTECLGNKKITVWADGDRLCQLFNNIMVNCTKYANTGGEVKLSLLSIAGGVQIIIEDDGEGVAPEHLENLFEHLYRVDHSRDRKTGGSGLGLAICKQIVEAHQGTVHAEKSELGGLAVVIDLPTV